LENPLPDIEKLPTWKDVQVRSLHDPVMRYMVNMQLNGRCSALEAMMALAIWYSHERETHIKLLSEGFARSMTNMEITLLPKPGDGKRWVIDCISPLEAHVEDV
jgi:hypothetical protein